LFTDALAQVLQLGARSPEYPACAPTPWSFLAEIRHRLANSFQLILALIEQQKRRSKSDETREILGA
jgi:hypothetical protein